MCKDEKKTTEAKVEDEKKLVEEELDEVSGGSGIIYDWKRGKVGPDGRVYPLVIDPDEDMDQ